MPLAFLFLKQDVVYRTVAILLAMLSDGLDGYFARRYQQSSRLGTLLDPLMDRLFVFFVIGVLMQEEAVSLWQVGALVCRDLSVLLFGFYLLFTGSISTYRFRAIWCGKATTFFQFLVFLSLTFGYKVPSFIFLIFILLGAMALIELYISKEETRSPMKG